jgi:hypothetical protein
MRQGSKEAIIMLGPLATLFAVVMAVYFGLLDFLLKTV